MSYEDRGHHQGPIGFWFLNDRLEPAVIDRQLDEFRQQGFSGVVLHPRDGLATPYLSESWFQALEYIMAACKTRGLQAWFYDENPFPSGSAGGMLLNRYPHLVGQRLAFHRMTIQPRDGLIVTPLPGTGRLLRVFAFEPGRTDVYEEITRHTGLVGDRWYVQGNRTQAYGPCFAEYPSHPHWRAWYSHETWTLDWKVADDRERQILVVRIERIEDSHHGSFVDLLHPETTQRFLELTHQTTLDRLGPERFSEFAAVFTDEPHLAYPYPWTEHLPAEYMKAYQEDLLSVLPHLIAQIDKNSPLIRCRYRRLLGRLWETNFIEPISRWCQDRKIPLSGHISPEEDPILMTLGAPGWARVISHVDWPGYDLVLSPFGPAEAAKIIGPKLVASLAHQQGKSHLMTECLGCGGEDLTIEMMKRMIDWLAIFGYDKYVIHGQFYSLDGHRKREAPPSIFYQAPYWRHFHTLSDYIHEISEWNSTGKPVRPIAVLLPLSSFTAWLPVENQKALQVAQDLGRLCGDLMANGLDFDLVIDEYLAQADVDKERKEFTVGQATYQALVVPAISMVETQGLNVLAQLQQAGVPVESLIPRIHAIEPSGPIVDFHNSHSTIETLRNRLIRKFRQWLRFPADRKVYVQSRQVDGQIQRRVWNPSDDPISLQVNGATVTLEPWQALVLKETATRIEPAAALPDPSVHFSGPWSLAPEEPNTLVLKRWQLRTSDGSVHLVSLPARTGTLPWGLDHETVTFWTELIVDGPLPEAELWFDRSTFGGSYEIRVNGELVEPAEPIARHDLHERRVRVGGALKSGVNRIDVKVGPVRTDEPAMLDPLRLVGWFKVLRTGMESTADAADVRPEWYKSLCPDDQGQARIVPCPRSLVLKNPDDWTMLGFPHYSGTMTYSNALRVDSPCGKIFLETAAPQRDAFEVIINGVSAGVCAWQPCRVEIGPWLKLGDNIVEIVVGNTAINRTEGKPQPSGLLGPVQITVVAGGPSVQDKSPAEPAKNRPAETKNFPSSARAKVRE